MERLDQLPDGADAYAVARLAAMPRPWRLWRAADGSLSWVGTDWEGGSPVLEAVGPSAETLVRALLASYPALPRSVALPRPTTLTPVSWSAEWDYRWLSSPPPYPARICSWLESGEHLAEVAALLGRSSPRAAVHPGDAWARRWCGIRDPEGLLVACACDESGVSPVSGLVEHGLIGGVATDPSARGQGLGADVTAWLAHQFFSEGAVSVGLGMWADNDDARRLYTRLGFRDEHSMTSMDVDL